MVTKILDRRENFLNKALYFDNKDSNNQSKKVRLKINQNDSGHKVNEISKLDSLNLNKGGLCLRVLLSYPFVKFYPEHQ